MSRTAKIVSIPTPVAVRDAIKAASDRTGIRPSDLLRMAIRHRYAKEAGAELPDFDAGGKTVQSLTSVRTNMYVLVPQGWLDAICRVGEGTISAWMSGAVSAFLSVPPSAPKAPKRPGPPRRDDSAHAAFLAMCKAGSHWPTGTDPARYKAAA